MDKYKYFYHPDIYKQRYQYQLNFDIKAFDSKINKQNEQIKQKIDNFIDLTNELLKKI